MVLVVVIFGKAVVEVVIVARSVFVTAFCTVFGKVAAIIAFSAVVFADVVFRSGCSCSC